MKSFLTKATALLFLSLATVSAGCGSNGGPPPHKDAGQGHDGPDMKITTHHDGGVPDGVVAEGGTTCGMNGPTQSLGGVCACDAECASGHCADGLCCQTACDNGCETCSAPDAGGSCVKRTFGASPRKSADCVADTASTCGLDGTCDGAGACHYYLGNTCVGGTCSGDSVVGAYACDGNGACKPGITQMLCIPYTCDSSSGTCFEACTTAQGQCDSQHSCDLTTGSCGKARSGAHCNDNSGCLSGYCADHVCCNIACQGACVACNLPGRLGACLPIDPGKPDPRGVCKDQGSASCGHNGTCDGVGGCANYARDTQCLQPSCTGNRLNTAGTCDGLGTCRAPGVQDCHPFRCVDGACTKSCETVNDCDQGTACTNKTCGPKPLGAVCASASECSTNFCVDGVCCESGLHRHLPVLRAPDVAGLLHDRRRRQHRSPRRLPGQGRCFVRDQRQVRRHRQLRDLHSRGRSAPPRPAAPASTRLRRPATPPASASPPTPPPATRTSATARSASTSARPMTSASRPTAAARPTPAGRSHRAPSAPIRTSARLGSHAPRATAATPPAAGPASRARSRARSASAPTCPPARSTRRASAWIEGPRPAAPTESATATAAARSTWRGRPASDRAAPAARRRSPGPPPATAPGSA